MLSPISLLKGFVARIKSKRRRLLPPFPSWAECSKKCQGYESQKIIDYVVAQSKKSISTTVTCREAQIYSALFVAGIRASLNDIRVLDFGGALGGLYQKLKCISACANIVSWTVVETSAMVDAATSAGLADSKLSFKKELSPVEKYDIVIASGVLQVMEKPFVIFNQLLGVGARYVILSLIPLIDGDSPQITAPPTLDYPIWVFSRNGFFSHVTQNAQIICTWKISDKYDVLHSREPVEYLGLLLEINQ